MLPVTKDVCINLIKVSEFNLSIFVIGVNHCFFRILKTGFQQGFTTVHLILHAYIRNISGVLVYVMIS